MIQIRPIVPLTEDPPQDIVYLLEGILSSRRARNKMLLPNPSAETLNIDLYGSGQM